ncbi:MAG: hypothetical protein A2Z30_04150 [Chloroflexi bacterium RBG_16_64_43]|nr:MAG: hypothetical protein A2Z30_04150 [Chloroflexi bacterium RBG_16_64_43]
MNTFTKSQLEIHVPVLGWLLIGSNLIYLLMAAVLATLLVGIGTAVGDVMAEKVLGIVAASMGGLLTVLGLPGIVAGAGLLARKTWGRILSIVISGLSVLCFPLGTILGVYGLIVLLQDSAAEYFAA